MIIKNTTKYEVQEKIDNRWLAISWHPEDADHANILYNQSHEENPDGEFRVVMIETKRTVVRLSY